MENDKKQKQMLKNALKKANVPLTKEEAILVLGKNSEDILNEMEAQGEIVYTRQQKVALPEMTGHVVGTVIGNAKGFAFVVPEGLEARVEDIFIPPAALNGAMHDDKVLVRVSASKSRGNVKRQEGEVVRTLVRAREYIIGRYEKNGNSGYVVPEDRRISPDIRIPREKTHGAMSGDLVQTHITTYAKGNRPPIGQIEEIIGKHDDPKVEVVAVIRHYGLHETFPERVANVASKMPQQVTEKDIKGRKDLRSTLTITIDGEDAKDLDDAISLERKGEGFLLGVHIADVSHYVTYGDQIDQEAEHRGTSVYFPGMVLPMLPVELSNGICSLHPNVDRLALSCLMDIDTTGKIVDYQFTPSVICSDYRMTYEDCNAMLEDNDKKLQEQFQTVYPLLADMQTLAKALKQRREADGSIDFDLTESEIKVDETGKVLSVGEHQQGISNHMIEQFMLSANTCAAKYALKHELPFLYRVHETPDQERIDQFYELLQALGIRAQKPQHEITPKALADILKRIKNTEYVEIVSMVMLRSMKKARYTDKPLGHFGLSIKDYCHFTSPIRRYPDLVVHRSIKASLCPAQAGDYLEKIEASVHAVGEESSKAERNAMEAERTVDDLKKAEYMKEHIGEESEGLISGVTDFGLFVRLPNTIEGLIPIAALDDDYYIYDEKLYRLTGRHTGTIFSLGDAVKIKVVGVNMESYRVEFELLEALHPRNKKKKRGTQDRRRKKPRKTRRKSRNKANR